MMSNEFMRLEHDDVLAVREDQDGRQPEIIDQRFKLVAWYKELGPVFFRLSFSIINNARTKTTIFLQIPPDRIHAFSPTICDTTDQSNPPCLDRVREVGRMRCVIRLQFQLHSDTHAQIIVPTDFTFDNFPCSPAQRTFRSAASLAAGSLFSLYIPHNANRLKIFEKLAQAVEQFPILTTTQDKAYERLVDLSSLYHGKGGIEFIHEVLGDPNGDRKRSHTPATIESSDTTVPFDTPHFRDSPPRYEACLDKEQRPRARSATAVSAESRNGHCGPPEYRDTERQDIAFNVPKRMLHFGSEDTDLHPPSKRNHLFAPGCTTTASTIDPQSLELWQFQLEQRCLQVQQQQRQIEQQQRQIEQQQLQIEQQQRQIEQQQLQINRVKGWHDELEEKYCDLENCQAEHKDAIDFVAFRADELEEECGSLRKQLEVVWDVDEIEDNMTETLKKHINDLVTTQVVGMKKKIRNALID